ncbi:hypothetical protein ACFWNK_34340 [Streptomyces sp. NPDC058417]
MGTLDLRGHVIVAVGVTTSGRVEDASMVGTSAAPTVDLGASRR